MVCFDHKKRVLDRKYHLTSGRLQFEASSRGIQIHRRVFNHIKEAFAQYPEASAVFNCTGLGALTLGGVEDEKIFSARVSALNIPVLAEHS